MSGAGRVQWTTTHEEAVGMAERSKTWISRGGTARSADPVHGGRGAEKLLENLRRLGADDWMIRSVEESSRNGRRTSRTASTPRSATPR